MRPAWAGRRSSGGILGAAEGRLCSARGYDIGMIGHENHPGGEDTSGQLPGAVRLVTAVAEAARRRVRDPDSVVFATQSTLSADDTRGGRDAVRRCFPKIVGTDLRDIRGATQDRQATVRPLASIMDPMLGGGARNKSNSERLCQASNSRGVPSYLIEHPAMLDPGWLRGHEAHRHYRLRCNARRPRAGRNQRAAGVCEAADRDN